MNKFLSFLLAGVYTIANAWNGHHLITYAALANANKKYQKTVTVESLHSFLEDVKNRLPEELSIIETSTENSKYAYKLIPKDLQFNTSHACISNIETCFKKAIRINLNVPLIPIIYDPNNLTQDNLVINRESDLMIKAEISNANTIISGNSFKKVMDGKSVPLIAVIAAGSQEPDFGFDIGLYKNNGSEFGKIYGFGNQPIGDVGLKYTSQVLFHMSSYNISTIFKIIKPDLKYSYPQYRFYQYMHLAQLAKDTGHLYWAARFTGWALHYLQDMTQPYHANLFNGFSTLNVLLAYIQSPFTNSPIEAIQNKLQARHIINENIAGYLMSDNNTHFIAEKEQIKQSLHNISHDKNTPLCKIDPDFVIDVVMPQTNTIGNQYSKALVNVFPNYIIDNNAAVNFNTISLYKVYSDLTKKHQKELLQLYRERMEYTGTYTRNCVNVILGV